MELLVTMAVTGIGLVAFITSHLGGLRAGNAINARRQLTGDQMVAALIALRLTKDIERADRIVIVNTGEFTIQPVTIGSSNGIILLRHLNCSAPLDPSACFDTASNYRWVQYRRDGITKEVVFYPDAFDCSNQVRMGRAGPSGQGQISWFSVWYENLSALPPPGGDPSTLVFPPAPADLNSLNFKIEWNNGLSIADPQYLSRMFRGLVQSRAIPYSDVGAGTDGLGDSGLGLGGPPPPAPAVRCF